MASSIVNGYFCTSSCDVAKAKKGQDPHPSTSAAQADGKDKADGTASKDSAQRPDDPAVILDGALGAVSGVTAISASGDAQALAAGTSRIGNVVDFLA